MSGSSAPTSVLYLTEAEMSESLLLQMLEETDVDFPTLGKPPPLEDYLEPPLEGWNCPAASVGSCRGAC